MHVHAITHACVMPTQVCIQPGDTVVDVGANIGLFALAAAEVRGPLPLLLNFF
jgi:ribosomal protein L11 methylase PrmA